jgi:hypothetical protein
MLCLPENETKKLVQVLRLFCRMTEFFIQKVQSSGYVINGGKMAWPRWGI